VAGDFFGWADLWAGTVPKTFAKSFLVAIYPDEHSFNISTSIGL